MDKLRRTVNSTDTNEQKVDLHIHSTASDGSASPSEIVSLAMSIGLRGVALTDHDTVSGLDEFIDAAAGKDITAIPGLEVSSLLFNKEVHILGFFIDHRNAELDAFLKTIRASRDVRNTVILQKLQAMGYQISPEELMEVAAGESVGRPHFASILVRKGYFEKPQDVFDKCLKRGTRAYTDRILPSPEETIRTIHNAGGIAVWAHPANGFTGRSQIKKYLKRLVGMGLDGIEAYYSLFSEAQTKMLLELAADENIIVTGGSDYHGMNQPSIELGTGAGDLKVPASVLENMMARVRKSNTN